LIISLIHPRIYFNIENIGSQGEKQCLTGSRWSSYCARDLSQFFFDDFR